LLESDQCELQVLKALTTNKRRALDFLDAYNENLFSKEYYLFAKSILSFAKAYKEVPSRKVLESRFKERQDIVDNFLNVWSVLDSVDYSDSDFGFYLDQLKNKYSNRVINNLRNSLSNTNLSDASLNHDKIIKSLQSEIVNLKEIRKGKKKVFKQETLKAYMPRFKLEYFQKASEEEKGRGILTGYSFLDYIKNGICPGEMVIVAAETGGGKSMFLNNMAIQMWMQQNTIYTDSENFGKGYNCLYFSLEMPYEACARRTMSRLADVPIYGLRDCKLNQLQADSLSQAVRFIDRYPYEFQIIDVPRGASVEEIERRYQEACDSFQPDFVVVDYLGLLEDREFSGDDWLKLGYIAGKVHEFGRVHNIATLTAVQLNRPQNKGKKDSSDLIGLHRIGRSSLIMHHANIGIQIETRKNEYRYSDLTYHIIKNRDGELGRHVLKKNFKNASISEMEEPYRPENFENGPAGDNGAIDISDYLKKIGWHES
jgi:replicative DNA helicase